MPVTPSTPDQKRDWLPLALGCLGILLHLAVGIFYLAAGLVAPLPAVIVFWVIWIALLVLGLWLLRRSPLWALLVPVAALVIFFAGITLGQIVFGWTA